MLLLRCSLAAPARTAGNTRMLRHRGVHWRLLQHCRSKVPLLDPPGPSSAGQPLQLCAEERAGERAARVHRRWGSGWEPRLQAAPPAPCPARGTAQVCPTPARTHPDPTPLTPHAEGRFIFSLQALGTLGVYLITGATFNSLYPLSQSARLTVTVGAGLLLLPLLLVPHGSGGLLSQKAVLHTQLSHYQDQDDPPPEDEEAAAGGRAAEGSLTQPLLQPGMQRDAAPEAAAAAVAAGAGHSTAAEQEEGSEADSELATAIAASLREAEAAGLASHQADAPTAGQPDFEPAVPDVHVQDLISFEPAVLDDGAPAARSAAADGLEPPPAAAQAEAATPPAAAPASDSPAAQEPQPATGRPPLPFAEPGPQAQLPPELSPMQCLRSSDFWLLFLVLCIGMGSGLTLVNNLSQLVKALTGGASALETTPVLVSAFSVCNCAGEGAAAWGWWELLWLWVWLPPALALLYAGGRLPWPGCARSGPSARRHMLGAPAALLRWPGQYMGAPALLGSPGQVTAATPGLPVCRRPHGAGLLPGAPAARARHAPHRLPAARLRPHGSHLPGPGLCPPARPLPPQRPGRLCGRWVGRGRGRNP